MFDKAYVQGETLSTPSHHVIVTTAEGRIFIRFVSSYIVRAIYLRGGGEGLARAQPGGAVAARRKQQRPAAGQRGRQTACQRQAIGSGQQGAV